MCGDGAGDSGWEEVTGGKIATREGLKKLLGIKDGFRYKTWENKPRNVQNLHRCQRDKSPLMASDMEAYAFWHLTQHRLGAYTRTGGLVGVGARTPPPKPSIMPRSYAIIFGLRPIST